MTGRHQLRQKTVDRALTQAFRRASRGVQNRGLCLGEFRNERAREGGLRNWSKDAFRYSIQQWAASLRVLSLSNQRVAYLFSR
ncbi:hypothetical protein TNCV_848351 [Trichonephila clavipes]|uniref:Uncharacterized protein n=1 Tax=Trichonephila clavipes TaxID=2585209 RepID=A0A8X6RMI1_TRICX|nr:hypothetical protein TNCV_848351 [Trichonephila clavipes]